MLIDFFDGSSSFRLPHKLLILSLFFYKFVVRLFIRRILLMYLLIFSLFIMNLVIWMMIRNPNLL